MKLLDPSVRAELSEKSALESQKKNRSEARKKTDVKMCVFVLVWGCNDWPSLKDFREAVNQ